jgi:hypothetical protein
MGYVGQVSSSQMRGPCSACKGRHTMAARCVHNPDAPWFAHGADPCSTSACPRGARAWLHSTCDPHLTPGCQQSWDIPLEVRPGYAGVASEGGRAEGFWRRTAPGEEENGVKVFLPHRSLGPWALPGVEHNTNGGVQVTCGAALHSALSRATVHSWWRRR